MNILWDEKKNERLITDRDISFGEVAELILQRKYKAILEHPLHRGQMIFIVPLKDYTHVVPFVIDKNDNIVLKTVFPSRKYHKRYGMKSHENKS
jgi:uncharacterized DUF497 family protein